MKALRFSTLFSLLFVLHFSLNAAHITPIANNASSENAKHNLLVRGIQLHGRTIPVVDLPLIEIIAFKNGPLVLSGQYQNGEIVAIANLPMVEIVGSRLKNKLAIPNDNAIYDIPVIEVTANFPKKNLVAATQNHNGTLLQVDLPIVEITAPIKSENKLLAHLFSAIGYFTIESTSKNIANYEAQQSNYESYRFMLVFGLFNWFLLS